MSNDSETQKRQSLDLRHLAASLAAFENPDASPLQSPTPQPPACSIVYVNRALLIIHERYQDCTLSRHEVSQIVHVYDNHFGRVFKRETGVSFRHYLLTLRMEKSKQLLSSSTDQIKSIAPLAGYRTQSHFAHDFHEYTGITPLEYRMACHPPDSSRL